jgi:hypothetical protein
MIVTEVQRFTFRLKDAPFYVPKGWDVFHAEMEPGMMTVYGRRGVHQEEPTPPEDNTEVLKSVGMGG